MDVRDEAPPGEVTEAAAAPPVVAGAKPKSKAFNVVAKKPTTWGDTTYDPGTVLATIKLIPGAEFHVGFISRLIEDSAVSVVEQE